MDICTFKYKCSNMGVKICFAILITQKRKMLILLTFPYRVSILYAEKTVD